MLSWTPKPPGTTVYLLGAGVNKCVHRMNEGSPPLIGEFFVRGLSMRRFSNEIYDRLMEPVYQFIEQRFGRTRETLARDNFNIEDCLTTLDDLLGPVGSRVRERDVLAEVRFRLIAYMAELLSEYELFGSFSNTMRVFAAHCLFESSTIITFNYDTILEKALESASGLSTSIPPSILDSQTPDRGLSDEVLTYSHCCWNLPLGYGFPFDEVQLQQAGVSKHVLGERFYRLSGNELYPTPILKLHGSLNWFRYLPYRSSPQFPGEAIPPFTEKQDRIILVHGNWWFGRPPERDGWFIEPIIVAHTMNKSRILERPPFPLLWARARIALERCKKLVIIGYSFAPSDSPARSLLRDVTSNHRFEEVVLVSPRADKLSELVVDLCHFSGELRKYGTVDEYVQVEIPLHRSVERLSPEAYQAAGLRVGSWYVVCTCRTCRKQSIVQAKLTWSGADALAAEENWTVCPDGHRQRSSSGDMEVFADGLQSVS